MSNFIPTKQYFRDVLLHYFYQGKSADESYHLLVETYKEYALSESNCREWFQRFASNNFDLRDEPREKFDDKPLKALLDEDASQTLRELSDILRVNKFDLRHQFKTMKMFPQLNCWLPRLKQNDLERRLITCELLLERQNRKSDFFHQIVTGDEKWIYYRIPLQDNRLFYQYKILKAMLCIWWDQQGVVYYELLQPGQTINSELYREQLMHLNQALKDKRPRYAKRQDEVILLHDNVRSHVAKPVTDVLEAFGWDVISHSSYSPDLSPSNYHLFPSMRDDVSKTYFSSYKNIEIWLKDWIASKSPEFFHDGIHLLREKCEMIIANDGHYCE